MPTRDRLLTQASPLSSPAKARFVNMLPRCSPVLSRCSLVLSLCSLMLARCSLVLLLSHFLVSCRSLWLLRSCNFKREHSLDAGQKAPYMASPHRPPWYPLLLPFCSLALFFPFLLILSALRYLVRIPIILLSGFLSHIYSTYKLFCLSSLYTS